MSRTPASIEMAGLDLLDLWELQEEFPHSSVRQLPDQLKANGMYGEPGTVTAMLLLAVTSVQALSAWLARRRAPGPGQLGFTVEIRSDNTVCIRLDPPTADAPAAPEPDPSTLSTRVEEISRVIASLLPPVE